MIDYLDTNVVEPEPITDWNWVKSNCVIGEGCRGVSGLPVRKHRYLAVNDFA